MIYIKNLKEKRGIGRWKANQEEREGGRNEGEGEGEGEGEEEKERR